MVLRCFSASDANADMLFKEGLVPVGTNAWGGDFDAHRWVSILSRIGSSAEEISAIPLTVSSMPGGRYLLRNHLGERVFASSDGRFVVGDGTCLNEKNRRDPGRFARADTPLSARTCAKAFFDERNLGMGIKSFASLVFGKFENELTKTDRDFIIQAIRLEVLSNIMDIPSETEKTIVPPFMGIRYGEIVPLLRKVRALFDKPGRTYQVDDEFADSPFSFSSRALRRARPCIPDAFLFPHENSHIIDNIAGGKADVSVGNASGRLGIIYGSSSPSWIFRNGGRLALSLDGETFPKNDTEVTEGYDFPEFSHSDDSGQQKEYRSASNAPHSAWIPEGLMEAQSIAADSWIKKHGNPLDYVAGKIRKDRDTVSSVLGGEQIDACAFAVSNCEKGESFLIADQTGLGKGRSLAAIREAFRGRENVFFITEKPNLFSDFLRDSLTVSGMDNPFRDAFRVNQDATPRYPDGTKCEMKNGGKVGRAIMESGIFPEDTSLVLSTYSQFSRKDKKDKQNEKKTWFAKFSEDSIALLDESHVATGDSSLSEFLKGCIKKTKANVYSSATHSKTDANFSFYQGLLKYPAFLPAIPRLPIGVGDACRFRIMDDIVRNGKGVRREQDLAGLDFSLVEDENDNREISDAFSYFIETLFKMSRIMNRVLPPHPELKGEPIVLLGGRLYRLTKQFFLSLKTDFAIRVARRSISNGRKPILVTESTLETLLTRLQDENDVWGDEDESGTPGANGIDFPRILQKAVDDTLSGWDLSVDEKIARQVKEMAEELRAFSSTFSFLPASPVDAIREGIGSCGEISGRNTRWSKKESGWEKYSREDPDRDETVRMFNDGRYDALIVTRAGCSGISLHASPVFEDRRPRDLIEIQIPANVAERLQFFGRVFRKGQVELPSIMTLSSGIPAEARMMLMQSKKLPGLTSYSGGKDGHPIAPNHGLPELYSPRGIKACAAFLAAYPGIRKALGIPDASQADGIARTDKLLSRMVMLPYKMQEDLMGILGDMLSMPVATSSVPRVIRSTPFDGAYGKGIASRCYVVELDFPETKADSINFESDTKERVSNFIETLRTSAESERRVKNLIKILNTFISGASFSSKGSQQIRTVAVKTPKVRRFCAIPEAWLLSFEINGGIMSMSGAEAIQWIKNGCQHSTGARIRIAIAGNPFRTLLLNRCGADGEFIDIDGIVGGEGSLLLPEGIAMDDALRLPVPLAHPDEVYPFFRSFKDTPLRSRDQNGKSLFFERINTGTKDRLYRISWEEGFTIEEEELDNFAFRKMTGSPKIGPDGKYGVVIDGRHLGQMLWHFVNRGIVLSAPPDKRNWRNTLETERMI